MSFRIRQDVYTIQTRTALLADSITVKVGDLLIPTAAGSILTNATGALAGDFYPIGLVQGFSYINGEVIGTGTAQTAANTPAQVTTTATNTSVAAGAVYVQYIPLTEDMELLGTLSAAAATTALSDKQYVYFNLLNANTINEASVVAYTNATPLQLLSDGLDPNDGTDFTVIVRLVKNSQNRP